MTNMREDQECLDAEQALKEGDLGKAVLTIQEKIKKSPSSVDFRVFLFQLLCVQGNWSRALIQLQTIAKLDPSKIEFVQAYHHLINAEAFRAEVFKGNKTPLVFGESAPWIATLINALQFDAAGDHSKASDLRGGALELAPTIPTIVNGNETMSWFADADSRLGPALEVVVNGGFYWIPQDAIKEVVFDPVEDLRDLIWRPLSITFANEGKFVGFMPVRYPGSECSENVQHQLARLTEWQNLGNDNYMGIGQRMFATPENDFAMLDVESLQFMMD